MKKKLLVPILMLVLSACASGTSTAPPGNQAPQQAGSGNRNDVEIEYYRDDAHNVECEYIKPWFERAPALDCNWHEPTPSY